MTEISQDYLEPLRRLATCDVANAIEVLKVRLRNEGFTNDVIKHFSGGDGPMVAHAVTLKIRCSSPATDHHDYLERTQWWDYILSIPAPRVVVIEDVDPQPGLGALVGETHANILRALNCIGAVTNGSLRDVPALQALKFHAYAARLSVSHAYTHIVEIGGPVEIAGLSINSGDLLHGDRHGIVSVPAGAETQIPQIAERIRAREQSILDICRAQTFSIETLREAVRAYRQSEP